MLPAAAVDPVLHTLVPLLETDDIVIDGGNSYYHDDIRRADELKAKGLHYVDVGVSGGVWGLERGYCHMIGGEDGVVQHLDPIFARWRPASTQRRAARVCPGSRSRRNMATCIAARTAPAISSRWSTTASNTA